MDKKLKVTVGMSGGVDSAVAAMLIKEAGYCAFGATMKLYCPPMSECGVACGSEHDIEDARAICTLLGMEHRVYDLSTEFEREIIGDFVNTYLAAGTPNPCILCNKRMKFGAMLSSAEKDGSDMIATGHYARIIHDTNGRALLCRAKDTAKDQSYFLWMLSQEQLSKALLPLGDLSKSEVRELAASNGFVNAHKGDSQDICFVPDGDYASFIEGRIGKKFPEGSYIDKNGRILGRHKGIIHYTIGQRKGLGISMGHHIYVCDKNAEDNTVRLGEESELFVKTVRIKNINLIACDTFNKSISARAKIRSRHASEPCCVSQVSEDELLLCFDTPQRAPARGQSAVIYDECDEVVIGGGIIA